MSTGYIELSLDSVAAPVKSIDNTLDKIAERYGNKTSALVALQREYTPGD